MGQVLIRGEQGKRILFVLPAALFVVSLTVIPLLFGIAIAFADWNLSSPTGPKFNGLGNIERMLVRPVLLERPDQHGVVLSWRSSWSTRSPSASRCC